MFLRESIATVTTASVSTDTDRIVKVTRAARATDRNQELLESGILLCRIIYHILYIIYYIILYSICIAGIILSIFIDVTWK